MQVMRLYKYNFILDYEFEQNFELDTGERLLREHDELNLELNRGEQLIIIFDNLPWSENEMRASRNALPLLHGPILSYWSIFECSLFDLGST